MRRLHVLGVSADGQELVLGPQPDGRGTHQVAVDERLRRVLRGERPTGGLTDASLSPREIQASLRSGASVEEVAAAAGTTVERIERYAGPVHSERAQVLAAALGAIVRRGRTARATMPLGPAMETALAAMTHVRPDTVSWHAWREPDGRWTVRYQVVVRGRTRVATWAFDQATRELTALDAFATALGFGGEPPARAGSRAGG